MNKVYFLNNSQILLCKAYYDSGRDCNWITLSPETIPVILVESLYNAFNGVTVLRISLFLDMDDPEINYVRSIAYIWDGITVIKKHVKLFGDGSFEVTEREVF